MPSQVVDQIGGEKLAKDPPEEWFQRGIDNNVMHVNFKWHNQSLNECTSWSLEQSKQEVRTTTTTTTTPTRSEEVKDENIEFSSSLLINKGLVFISRWILIYRGGTRSPSVRPTFFVVYSSAHLQFFSVNKKKTVVWWEDHPFLHHSLYRWISIYALSFCLALPGRKSTWFK